MIDETVDRAERAEAIADALRQCIWQENEMRKKGKVQQKKIRQGVLECVAIVKGRLAHTYTDAVLWDALNEIERLMNGELV